MSGNGRLRPNQLRAIAGGGRLHVPAAVCWNAFARYCKAHSVTVEVNDSYRPLGTPGDLARGVWSQWAAWERYQQGGNLAAYPGTSNHGLGIALDVPAGTQQAIAMWGAQFGWDHSWTDAPSEPWHHKFAADKVNWAMVNKWRGPRGAVKAVVHRVRHGGPVIVPKPRPAGSRFFADIYEGDSTFDAKKYRASGCDLIVLKASEGHTYQDPSYVGRVHAARAAGLIVYSYHFARPGNGNTPADEAANFAGQVRKAGTMPTDRLILDWEDPKFDGKPGDLWIQGFIRELAKLGFTLRILYSGGPYIEGTVKAWPTDETHKALKYWHAAYTAHPESNVPAIASHHLWAVQFTDGQSGNQPHQAAGIGPCDLSYIKGRK